MVSTEIQFTVVFQPKKEKLIQSAKTIPDLVSDHEFFIARFRLKLDKVGKTTRPFRYDLNQNPMIIQWNSDINSRIRSDRQSA